MAHEITHGGDEQQIATHQQQGGGVKHQLTRDPDFIDPVAVSGGRQQQQGHERGMDQATHMKCIGIEALKQNNLGKQIKVVDKGACQPQADRLGAPGGIFGQVAKKLLKQHQSKHCQQQNGKKHGLQSGCAGHSRPGCCQQRQQSKQRQQQRQ